MQSCNRVCLDAVNRINRPADLEKKASACKSRNAELYKGHAPADIIYSISYMYDIFNEYIYIHTRISTYMLLVWTWMLFQCLLACLSFYKCAFVANPKKRGSKGRLWSSKYLKKIVVFNAVARQIWMFSRQKLPCREGITYPTKPGSLQNHHRLKHAGWVGDTGSFTEG